MKDGMYSIRFSDDKSDLTYQAERINGEWFFSDGTGWTEKIPDNEVPLLVVLKDITDAPRIERDTAYENKPPLTDYFPKE